MTAIVERITNLVTLNQYRMISSSGNVYEAIGDILVWDNRWTRCLGFGKKKKDFFVVMQKLPRPVLGQDFSTS